MTIQIGTIAYKQNDKYAKAFPLLAKETEELKQATKNLFGLACDMFITDLLKYCTTASVLRAGKLLAKNKN